MPGGRSRHSPDCVKVQDADSVHTMPQRPQHPRGAAVRDVTILAQETSTGAPVCVDRLVSVVLSLGLPTPTMPIDLERAPNDSPMRERRGPCSMHGDHRCYSVDAWSNVGSRGVHLTAICSLFVYVLGGCIETPIPEITTSLKLPPCGFPGGRRHTASHRTTYEVVVTQNL